MKRSTVWMFVFWGVLLVFGCLDHFFLVGPHAQTYYFSSLIIITFFMFFWFLADARDSNIKLSSGLKICVVAIGFLAIPYSLVTL